MAAAWPDAGDSGALGLSKEPPTLKMTPSTKLTIWSPRSCGCSEAECLEPGDRSLDGDIQSNAPERAQEGDRAQPQRVCRRGFSRSSKKQGGSVALLWLIGVPDRRLTVSEGLLYKDFYQAAVHPRGDPQHASHLLKWLLAQLCVSGVCISLPAQSIECHCCPRQACDCGSA